MPLLDPASSVHRRTAVALASSVISSCLLLGVLVAFDPAVLGAMVPPVPAPDSAHNGPVTESLEAA